MSTKAKIKYLDMAELPRLFNAINADQTKHKIRNEAIFRLAEYCALRIGEIGLINIRDYNPITHQIYCRRLKNSNDNTLKILDIEVIKALDNYLLIRDLYYPKASESGTTALFVSQHGNPISPKSLDKLMRQYAQTACIPKDKQHFHVLKHTRAIELGDAGVEIKDIQWWLGHRSINNTLIYAQFTTTQQKNLYKYLEERIYHYAATKNETNQCFFQ